MANLENLFKRAKAELPGCRLRRTSTQEVLEVEEGGVAWRPLSGSCVLQIYPPSTGRKAFRDSDYFVIKDAEHECRYFDPDRNLKPNQWSYVGCSCSSLPDEAVLGWIRETYKFRRQTGARNRAGGIGKASMEKHHYTVILEREGDGGYHAFCPALKGCHTQGDTLEEALGNVREAIEAYLESLQKHGEAVPVEDILIKPVEVALWV